MDKKKIKKQAAETTGPTRAQQLAVAQATGVPLFRVAAFADGKALPAETTNRIARAVGTLGLAGAFQKVAGAA